MVRVWKLNFKAELCDIRKTSDLAIYFMVVKVIALCFCPFA